MSKLVRPTVLFLSVFLVSELQAELVTMSFTAVTRDVVGDPFGIALRGGEPIRGTFTYDTESTIRSPPLGFQELYTQTDGTLTSYEITIDGDTVLTPFTNDWYVAVHDGPDQPNDCIFSGASEYVGIGHGASPAGLGSVAVNGVEVKNVGFSFGIGACNGNIMPGTLANLPNPLPSFEAWEAAGGGGGGQIKTDGLPPLERESAFSLTITSFQVVPEPSAYAYGILSLLLLAYPVLSRLRGDVL